MTPLSFYIVARLPQGNVQVTTWIESPAGDRINEQDWGAVGAPDVAVDSVAQLVWKIAPWRSVGFGKYKLHMTQDGVDSIIEEFELRRTE